MNKTEKALFEQILKIGEEIESIIDNNAGLIDSDNLQNEMVQLGTHLRIIRKAYRGEYLIGTEKLAKLEKKTFPNIETQIDDIFKQLKDGLKKLS